jgi:hypothetical protein
MRQKKLYGAALQKHLNKQFNDWLTYHQATLDLIDEIDEYKRQKDLDFAGDKIRYNRQRKVQREERFREGIARGLNVFIKASLSGILVASTMGLFALFFRPSYLRIAVHLGFLSGASTVTLRQMKQRDFEVNSVKRDNSSP